MTENRTTMTGSPLDQIIAEYLQALESGAVPSRQEILAKYPDYAQGLQQFFADYDRLDNRAGNLSLGKPTSERITVKYFGDYELVEEIARGGMGVVYKARQKSLNRVVALKMILKGELASPLERYRFRTEAEAAAGLDHPGIVPIYEVGEHDGHPYFTMKYVEGPTLTRAPKATVKVEVSRLAAVAKAVHYAHQRGVLHRDLKPSNILMQVNGVWSPAVMDSGDATLTLPSVPAESPLDTAEPMVADFGLAKKIDADRSVTESGALLGTPRYMAPEQAEGRKGLTTAADIYSLGVILYERLCGRTPFLGDSILDILRQLRESEPPKPTSLVPGLHRDLETVCLQCLRKEPTARYSSAEALAEDLSRWLRGEPIAARPLGRVQKVWFWCKRNPALTGLTAATALTMLTGTGVSTYFAIQANRRATEADKARDVAERTLVGSYLRPLGYNEKELDPAERYAMFELAEKDDRLKLLFLEEALATPDTALRLGRRTELVVQAAVGTSEKRRRAALQLCSRIQRESKLDATQRASACLLAIELRSLDLPAIKEVVENETLNLDSLRLNKEQAEAVGAYATKAMNSENRFVFSWHDYFTTDAIKRMSDEEISKLHSLILATLSKYSFDNEYRNACQVLAAIAPRLNNTLNQSAYDALEKCVLKTTDTVTLAMMTTAMKPLATNCPKENVNKNLEALLSIATQTNDKDALDLITATTSCLCEKKSTEEANALAIRLIKDSKNVEAWQSITYFNILKNIAPRLQPLIAQEVIESLLPNTNDAYFNKLQINQISLAVKSLQSRTGKESWEKLAEKYIKYCENSTNVELQCILLEAMTAFIPDISADTKGKMAKLSLNKLYKEKNTRVLLCLQNILLELNRYNCAGVREECQSLILALGQNEDADALMAMSIVLDAVMKRLSTDELSLCRSNLEKAATNATTLSQFFFCYNTLTKIAILSTDKRPIEWGFVYNRIIKNQYAKLENNKAAWPDYIYENIIKHVGMLNAENTSSLYMIIIGKLKQSPNTSYTKIGECLRVIGPLLDQPTTNLAFDKLIDSISELTEIETRDSAIEGIKVLAKRVPPEKLKAASVTLEKLIGKEFNIDTYYLHTSQLKAYESICEIGNLATHSQILNAQAERAVKSIYAMRNALRLKPMGDIAIYIDENYGEVIRQSIETGDLTIDELFKKGGEYYGKQVADFNYTVITRQVKDTRILANALSHPACTGEARNTVLNRLGEIAFPPTTEDLKLSLATSTVTGPAGASSVGIAMAGHEANQKLNPRFRNTWEAVEWLKKQHPDFDFDAPYKQKK